MAMTDANTTRSRPPRIFAFLLFVIGLSLAVGGFQLVSLGGSPYYVLAGMMTVGASIMLWRGDRRGSWLYGAMLAATVLWALWEVGLDWWALAPRLIGPVVLGLWLLTPWVQRRLDRSPIASPRAAGVGIAVAGAVVIAVALAAAQDNLPAGISGRSDTWVENDSVWDHYGGSLAGTRFSPLEQITPDNVAKLRVAWTFRTGTPSAGIIDSLETTPIKVGNRLFVCDGQSRVFALDADSGKQVWSFDPKVDRRDIMMGICRGVAYYRAPEAVEGELCADRIIANALDGRLLALDMATGMMCPDFGKNGQIDLKKGMGPIPRGYYSVTSAPTIVRGKIVVGGMVLDNQSLLEPSGVVRAFDARTGAFAWAWDMGRPGETGEPAEGETYTRGTPNSWAPASGDEELGLVYVPTGNATPDFWGGARSEEMDKYASAVVALDAETGEVRWSFQTVHHDVWDYDVGSQPTLVDLPGPDGPIPALIQPTKRGETFLLDRRTGVPISPVAERPVPQGAAKGDRLSPTQPFSVGMPSLSGPPLDEAAMWGVTPLDQLWCRIHYKQADYRGTFTPPGVEPFIVYPGFGGGSDWGSVAVDPERLVMIANVNHFAHYGRLVPRADADKKGMKPIKDLSSYGLMGFAQSGTPFAAIVEPLISPLYVPCQQPPYGTIAAIDLVTRETLWSKPLGNARNSGPLGMATHLPIPLGVPNMGGAALTRTGLAFIAAAQDKMLRAYDLQSGEVLWSSALPVGGHATPMTYMSAKGRQFVVVAAGGNSTINTGAGDYIIAYALE